ncbi:hypothetical protein ACFQZV_03830 [Microbacterium koreense]|uniref:DUF2188 domain-containing protein n=1 Tax=Microbacterium koreense TaxID=323761 RepID=A0ABW2ZPD1_9MICO
MSAGQQGFTLHEIAEGSWRLCDESVDDDHPLKVVAYVERTPEGDFEVVWVRGAPRSIDRFPTHEEVVAAAARVRAERSDRFKPDPIPHLPPLTAVRSSRAGRARRIRPERP